MISVAHLVHLWLICGVFACLGVLELSGRMPVCEGMVSRGMWRAFGGSSLSLSLGVAMLATGLPRHCEWLSIGGCVAMFLGIMLFVGTLGHFQDTLQSHQAKR